MDIYMHSCTPSHAQKCTKGSWKMCTDQSHVWTYRHYSPQWVLFLPDWATAQTGKRGCTGVHPADITKGKQDTAGQKWPPEPTCLRRTKDYILHEASWGATVWSYTWLQKFIEVSICGLREDFTKHNSRYEHEPCWCRADVPFIS